MNVFKSGTIEIGCGPSGRWLHFGDHGRRSGCYSNDTCGASVVVPAELFQ